MTSKHNSHLSRSATERESPWQMTLAACSRLVRFLRDLLQRKREHWRARERDTYLAQSQSVFDLERRMRRLECDSNELWSGRAQY